MRVVHIVPEAAKRVGGIDGFLDGLNASLAEKGVSVEIVESSRSLAAVPEGDIYHFHGLWQIASGGIAAAIRRRGGRYIVSPHGMLESWAMRHRFWKKLPYFFLREIKLLKGATELLATSELESRNIRFWVPGAQPTVLPLGISERRYPSQIEAREKLRWAEHEKILLFLSRLHPKKGLELLLRALQSEPQIAGGGWRLVVVGEGISSYENKLKKLAGELRSLPPVDWIGAVWDDRKWDYLAGADTFCLPTYSENFGLAVLESLACGTPVITTDSTPWQSIADWPGCEIVPPTVAGIRRALARMNPEFEPKLRMELSQLALSSFGWSRLVERYVEFYDRACAK